MPSKSTQSSQDASPEKAAALKGLGRRVRELRLADGLTQESLATAAGMHWTFIGQIERGERNATYWSILRVARGLGVPPSRLVQDD
jgi:transcriptional regulator with XRE-family HTH domain